MVAVGEGGSATLDKNRARRSSCLFCWFFIASSLRRSGAFWPPRIAFRSRDTLSKTSSCSRPRPSGTRHADCSNGEGYLGEILGGGDRCLALKPSLSASSSPSGKGVQGAGWGFSGEAGEMHIKGMREPAGCNMGLGIARMTDDTWLKTYGGLRRRERKTKKHLVLVFAPTILLRSVTQPSIAPGTAAKISDFDVSFMPDGDMYTSFRNMRCSRPCQICNRFYDLAIK